MHAHTRTHTRVHTGARTHALSPSPFPGTSSPFCHRVGVATHSSLCLPCSGRCPAVRSPVAPAMRPGGGAGPGGPHVGEPGGPWGAGGALARRGSGETSERAGQVFIPPPGTAPAAVPAEGPRASSRRAQAEAEGRHQGPLCSGRQGCRPHPTGLGQVCPSPGVLPSVLELAPAAPRPRGSCQGPRHLRSSGVEQLGLKRPRQGLARSPEERLCPPWAPE